MPLEITPVAVKTRSAGFPKAIAPLCANALRRTFDLGGLAFETTDTVEDLAAPLGQARAAAAMRLAVSVPGDGYNLFVMGPPGSGKRTLVTQILEERASAGRVPRDWVYVNNFASPAKPLAFGLPAGEGAKLKKDMAQLVEELRTAIPAVFESDEYRSRASQLEAEFSERHEKAFAELAEEAAANKIAVVRTPAGFSLAPLKESEVMSPEEFAQLPQAEQEHLQKIIAELHGKLEQIVRHVIDWRREWRQRLKQLNREMTLFAVGHLVGDLKQRYAGVDRLGAYLDAVEHDVIENADDFRPGQTAGAAPFAVPAAEPSFARYSVNVIVEHEDDKGAPVIEVDHPTYHDLVGRVDHLSQFGTLVTDFTMVRRGALHRANGGYLIVDARKLLMQPFAWEALKRALLTREIRIESLAEAYSLVSTVSLTPEPIPLDLKVVLIGERSLYYVLCQYDPEFPKLFKVVADFDDALDATEENLQGYVKLAARIARRQHLLPFARGAVESVIEHASRLAGDARKLATRVEAVSDLMCEADHYARACGRQHVSAADLEAAVAGQRARLARMHGRVHEAIMRGTLMIDTAGSRVGQVNGLSVFELGELAFAEPTRITATTRLGDGQVIDVQREVELGGAIHSKGVLILSSFIAARFSQNRPHALAASLVFEQTYGLVEGDSASLAELCALLSSLADVPVRQSFAVTGSVNQLGEVQAIGAVNEKIEGFFDICAARGLAGEEAVIIPATNVEHLMLKREVVEAAAAGRFAIYAVRNVDEAIELLTGTSAGAPDIAGGYPEHSINGRVARRLRELSKMKLKLLAWSAERRRRQRARSS